MSILEKAYMKVNGGYDFPGSNSGIDMHALTGWVPEQLRTDSGDFKRDRLWQRMTSASKFGDCLITVATGSRGSRPVRDTVMSCQLFTPHVQAHGGVGRRRKRPRADAAHAEGLA